VLDVGDIPKNRSDEERSRVLDSGFLRAEKVSKRTDNRVALLNLSSLDGQHSFLLRTPDLRTLGLIGTGFAARGAVNRRTATALLNVLEFGATVFAGKGAGFFAHGIASLKIILAAT